MDSPPLFSPPKIIDLPAIGTWPETRHEFDAVSTWAIHAALASGRPLLLRGEPGIGKSQLARAAAEFLKVPFLPFVVDERTERDQLFYELDAVGRLAQAQLVSVQYRDGNKDDTSWEEAVAEKRFVRPGVMWWAYDWDGAEEQLRDHYFRDLPPPSEKPDRDETLGPPPCSAVVLIDEVDKADPSVPNGLLECLANDGFDATHLECPVRCSGDEGASPLVILTTNEERELPPAFLRRCLVLHSTFPPKGETVEKFLLNRAKVHLGEANVSDEFATLMKDEIVPELLRRRNDARDLGAPKPGAAEFLDLVRVLEPLDAGGRAAAFAATKEFALVKHRADEE